MCISMMGHDMTISSRRNQLLSFGVALAAFLAIVQPATSFVTPPTSRHMPQLTDDRSNHHLILFVAANPNAGDDDNQHMECAALLPAQAVQVKLGEIAQARKAWKKRRRSGSPLLIPVEILGLDRTSLVRNNVLAILLKYGNPITNQSAGGLSSMDDLPRNGVCLSVSKLCKLTERDYCTNLRDNSHVLGFDGVGDMLISLFGGGDDDSSAQDTNTSKSNTYGVKVVKGQDNLLLVSKLTKRQAREEVSKVCLAHVGSISASDDTTDEASFASHLGTAKVRQDRGPPPTFTTVPLAAAVRVKQEDVEEGRVQSNDLANAFVFSFEQPQSTEDNEGSSPLLTLALHPPPRRAANNKRNQRRQETRANAEENISRKLKSLKVGEGPLKGTVVAVSPRAGAAFVDVGVGRERSKRLGGGTTRVLGMLRFEDFPPSSPSGATVDDEDEEESMTIEDLAIEDFEAEWDEASKMSVEEEIEYDGEAFDEDDDFAGLSPEERLREIGIMLDEESASSGPAPGGSSSLRPGDSVDVYIKAISRQSGRFMVTGDPSIKGKKAKDVKMEKMAQKRMDKLAKSLGGEDGLTDLLSSVGLEFTGVVMAASKSNAGACYYVQPVDSNLPVGIASCDEQEGAMSLSPGDEVRIRLDGVDEKRGQISFTML